MTETTTQRQLRMMSSLYELRKEKWVPFTLGPLYVYGRVPFNILARFAEEAKTPVYVATVDFTNFKLFELPDHAHTLFAMDDNAYSIFQEWLRSVEISDMDNNRFFVPIRTAAAIADPFMREIGAQNPTPELIDVWSISSTSGMLVPETHVETLPYPIFKVGEAETLTREQFLNKLPRPATAPEIVKLITKPADPAITLRGREIMKRGTHE